MLAIESRWDNDERTIYTVICRTGWTWEQFKQAIDKSYEIIGKLDYKVDFVMAFLSMLPTGDVAGYLTHAGGTQPSNIYRTVIVNNSTRFLDIIVKNADRKEGWVGPTIVLTLDEARKFLSS